MLTDKCKGQEALIMDMEMKEEEYKEIDSANNILQQQVHRSNVTKSKCTCIPNCRATTLEICSKY